MAILMLGKKKVEWLDITFSEAKVSVSLKGQGMEEEA
jgi:hypothetical protein